MFLLHKVGGDMMTAVAAITSVRKVLQTASIAAAAIKNLFTTMRCASCKFRSSAFLLL
jgi:hypothetical protein